MAEQARRVTYICDMNLIKECDRIPNVESRSRMVQTLIAAYGLLNANREESNVGSATEDGKDVHLNASGDTPAANGFNSEGTITPACAMPTTVVSSVSVVPSRLASELELTHFHSNEYVEFAKKASQCSDHEKLEKSLQEEFGLEFDCPIVDNLLTLMQRLAGGSLVAAEKLIYSCHETTTKVADDSSAMQNGLTNGLHSPNEQHVAVNWFGGWHHAQRDQAEGFCYVNDIVLAIQKLCKRFDRILYIDLDVHHGNGVQNAFEYTSRVMTLSLHKHEHGFYPGTGSLDDVGSGRGRFYSVNVPLREGIGDQQYQRIFETVFGDILVAYNPQVIVCQCGADGISGDPLGGGFNLTPHALAHCVQLVLDTRLPCLFLGGGGYHLANTARCWTLLTSLIVGKTISEEIPDNAFFSRYGPDFEMSVSAGMRPNRNGEEYVQTILKQIKDNLKHIVN